MKKKVDNIDSSDFIVVIIAHRRQVTPFHARTASGRPRNPALMFFREFGKAYKKTSVSQRQVSAACKAVGIDQKDRSKENLARAHAELVTRGVIAI
jgi:hypothetical protein